MGSAFSWLEFIGYVVTFSAVLSVVLASGRQSHEHWSQFMAHSVPGPGKNLCSGSGVTFCCKPGYCGSISQLAECVYIQFLTDILPDSWLATGITDDILPELAMIMVH